MSVKEKAKVFEGTVCRLKLNIVLFAEAANIGNS